MTALNGRFSFVFLRIIAFEVDRVRKFREFFKETCRYIAAGFVTAFVNLSTFYLLSEAFSVNYLISNLIAWLLTVITGYTVDKKYVFKDRKRGKNELLKFFGSRVLSLAIDQLMIWLLVDFAGISSSLAKIVDSAAVVVINYLLSRKIFKKPRKKEG